MLADHMPWHPMQPICVKERPDHRDHQDLEKPVERPFRFLSGPRPQSDGGHATFDVKDTLSLLHILLTGEIPSKEEDMTLHLHGLPARCIAFAVHQLVGGKDSWMEHN